MQLTPLIAAGIELMLMGMGTVFVFLSLLVFATGLMSRLVLRFAPAADIRAAAGSPSDEEVAAIGIAVAKYRQGRGDN